MPSACQPLQDRAVVNRSIALTLPKLRWCSDLPRLPRTLENASASSGLRLRLDLSPTRLLTFAFVLKRFLTEIGQSVACKASPLHSQARVDRVAARRAFSRVRYNSRFRRTHAQNRAQNTSAAAIK